MYMPEYNRNNNKNTNVSNKRPAWEGNGSTPTKYQNNSMANKITQSQAYKSPYGYDLTSSANTKEGKKSLEAAYSALRALSSGGKAPLILNQPYSGACVVTGSSGNCQGDMCARSFSGEYSSGGLTTPH